MPRPDVAHPSTAAIAGHPIHPALVPLPIGAAVLAFASDLAAARTGDLFWAHSSRWLLRVSLPAGGGGPGSVGGAAIAEDRTPPAGIDEVAMASEDDADRAREARVPRDGPVPGSLVSSEPAGPGGLVATGTAARPVDAHADPSGSGASPLDPGAADAIARELARGEEPEEGRADIPDDDRS